MGILEIHSQVKIRALSSNDYSFDFDTATERQISNVKLTLLNRGFSEPVVIFLTFKSASLSPKLCIYILTMTPSSPYQP